ncbi:MAG: hypothetical protein JMDDDDMK_02110 [Acidobacteria bacterium]|nr:hypothetical protein [Acidobacteriota bacterium]
MRQRPAPNAARTATSRCRPAARASSRLATFAQAISKTIPTAPSSTNKARRISPVNCVRSGTTLTPQLALKSYERSNWPPMTFISACACSNVTPGLSLATDMAKRPRRCFIDSSICHGAHISAILRVIEPPLTCQLKSAGITPTTVVSLPFRISLRPMICGSPPNRRCHKPKLSATTRAAPGLPSSSVKVRPIIGFTPRTLKRLGVAICDGISSGSPPLVRLAVKSKKVAMSSKTRFCVFQS